GPHCEPAHRTRELGKEVVHCRSPERVLRCEMVVDLRLVCPDAPSDGARGSAVESLGAKFHRRGIEQKLTDVLADGAGPPHLAPGLLHLAKLPYYRLIIKPKEKNHAALAPGLGASRRPNL